MNQYYEIIGVSGKGQALDEVRDNEGIRTEIIDMTRTISPIKDLIATYKLYQLLKKERPHIVHTHTPKAGIVGMLAAKFAGVKHRFHTIAGMPLLESKGVKRKLLNFVEKLTYYCATKVFPNSYGLYDIVLSEKFTTHKKLKVIGKGSSNGINVDHFDSTKYTQQANQKLINELNIKNDEFIFIYVGRLVTDKGINELIAAFNIFTMQYNNVKLILVGSRENNLDPLLKETEETLINNKHIIQVGYQTDVRHYFAISHALVFPSYREGFPNVVLQAGAMNTPSIVTDINGCNEIISHGVNGLIIPPKDVHAIVDAMCHLKENPEIHRIMCANSRKIIASSYKHTYIWEELLKEYQKTNSTNDV